MEQLIVFALFALALGYLINLVRKQFVIKKDAGCAKGCGTCSTADIEKAVAQMEKIKSV